MAVRDHWSWFICVFFWIVATTISLLLYPYWLRSKQHKLPLTTNQHTLNFIPWSECKFHVVRRISNPFQSATFYIGNKKKSNNDFGKYNLKKWMQLGGGRHWISSCLREMVPIQFVILFVTTSSVKHLSTCFMSILSAIDLINNLFYHFMCGVVSFSSWLLVVAVNNALPFVTKCEPV